MACQYLVMLNNVCLLEGIKMWLHGAQRAYVETPQTLMPHAATQPTHLEIVIFAHEGCHHALATRLTC
jgi:hypothetical protein